jgi:type IV pilus assembly protein PilQ
MRMLLAAGMALALPGAVRADPSMCERGKIYRGTPMDLDVKDADLHDLFRLLADVGRVNIVIGEGVGGKTTLRLRRVPWDQIVCTVAAAHRLEVTVNGNVVLVRRPDKP